MVLMDWMVLIPLLGTVIGGAYAGGRWVSQQVDRLDKTERDVKVLTENLTVLVHFIAHQLESRLDRQEHKLDQLVTHLITHVER